MEQALDAGIQVIKRFSGGGTVAVDHDTIFATLIVQVRPSAGGWPSWPQNMQAPRPLASARQASKKA